MTALLLAVLAASLAGSLHCVGMCGGLVAAVAAARGPGCGPRGRLADQVTYHGGRAVGYALVGLVSGALGAVLDVAGRWGGLQRAAAWAAGVAMIAWGVHGLLAWRGLLPATPRLPGRGLLARAYGVALRAGPRTRALLTGALTPLLPCGWLYLFVATAAGTGSALGGAGVMAAFWLGTVPAMLGLGLGLGAASGPLRAHLPRLLPVLRGGTLVVVGALTLTGRATLHLPRARAAMPTPAAAPAPSVPAPAPATAALEAQVRRAAATKPPCCCCEGEVER
jgi:sulfite exporter TauE/SafE